MNDVEREAAEDELYDLLCREAEGQYGARGSYELERFMCQVSDQIQGMTDEQLMEELERRG